MRHPGGAAGFELWKALAVTLQGVRWFPSDGGVLGEVARHF